MQAGEVTVVKRDDPRWRVGEMAGVLDGAALVARAESAEKEKKLEEKKEKEEVTAKFMKSVEEAKSQSRHDDHCPFQKGKECGCRDNFRELVSGAMKRLESKQTAWATIAGTRTAELVRVDDGKTVKRMIADPLSPRNPPIQIEDFHPPRWICLECARSMRSALASDIDHHCDEQDLVRAKKPMGLELSIPSDVRFGGGYRLVLWRDKAGGYNLGEEVVMENRVVEQRHLYGPDAYDIIEGALLDAAVTKLAP